MKSFDVRGTTIIRDGWMRLFKIQEPIFTELCWEFFATISFPGGSEYYNPNAITFCLAGELRQCSIAELAWRVGLYDQNVIMSEDFETYLEQCHKNLPEEVVTSTWWNSIANRVYIPSSA